MQFHGSNIAMQLCRNNYVEVITVTAIRMNLLENYLYQLFLLWAIHIKFNTQCRLKYIGI